TCLFSRHCSGAHSTDMALCRLSAQILDSCCRLRRFLPVALTILAGYLFNMQMFHLFLDHAFSPSALLAGVLWAGTFIRNRDSFRTILRPRPPKPLPCDRVKA